MPSVEARVTTQRASRYLVQLCAHLSAMSRMHGRFAPHGGRMPEVQHVEWSDDSGVVRMRDGTCTLRATSAALLLRLDAVDDAALAALQRGFGDRVQTIGRRDGLQVQWEAIVEPGSEPTSSPTDAGTPSGRSRPRRELLVVLGIGAVVAIVAVHLGVGGAAWILGRTSAPVGPALVSALALGAVVLLAHGAAGGVIKGGAWLLVHGRRRPKR